MDEELQFHAIHNIRTPHENYRSSSSASTERTYTTITSLRNLSKTLMLVVLMHSNKKQVYLPIEDFHIFSYCELHFSARF